jgi:hypothetical protein
MTLWVMAGLVPAIPLRGAQCPMNRDHRDSALCAGPVMTSVKVKCRWYKTALMTHFDRLRCRILRLGVVMRRRDFIALLGGAVTAKIAISVGVAVALVSLLSIIGGAFAQKRPADSAAQTGSVQACFNPCFKQCVSTGSSNASCSRTCYAQCSGIVGDMDNRF